MKFLKLHKKYFHSDLFIIQMQIQQTSATKSVPFHYVMYVQRDQMQKCVRNIRISVMLFLKKYLHSFFA